MQRHWERLIALAGALVVLLALAPASGMADTPVGQPPPPSEPAPPGEQPPPPVGRSSSQQTNADRAILTYQAMQQYFYSGSLHPGDRSGLYSETSPPISQRYSFLWPFSRALVGTITLSAIPPRLLSGQGFQTAARSRINALSRYFDRRDKHPSYESYPLPPLGGGGDKYYDDQAWIGVAAAHYYQLTANRSARDAALRVFQFVYPGGWDRRRSDAAPGGIFWVQQGVGAGSGNHDRTATANAPNAELAYLLARIDRHRKKVYTHAATSMEKWLIRNLYNVPTDPLEPYAHNPAYDALQPPLMFDHIDLSGGIDPTQWTYNQGATVATNVLAYRMTGNVAYLHIAEAIADAALTSFSEGDYVNSQVPAFNAIYFRGLLTLYDVTQDQGLRGRIIGAMSAYADDAWTNYRDSRNLFHFPSSDSSRDELLVQAAMLQVFSALAWDAGDYAKLP